MWCSKRRRWREGRGYRREEVIAGSVVNILQASHTQDQEKSSFCYVLSPREELLYMTYSLLGFSKGSVLNVFSETPPV